jgi:hypothetical protein
VVCWQVVAAAVSVNKFPILLADVMKEQSRYKVLGIAVSEVQKCDIARLQPPQIESMQIEPVGW